MSLSSLLGVMLTGKWVYLKGAHNLKNPREGFLKEEKQKQWDGKNGTMLHKDQL